MTIPLDNLYDYIFSLTGHTNKNLMMFRFSPNGSKSMKNLIVHNNVDNIFFYLSNKVRKKSWHYKMLFCYDQEPLNYDYYTNDVNERKEMFEYYQGKFNDFINPIGKNIMLKRNILGHPITLETIYDKRVLLHSERNSADLKKYERNGFVGAYYWSHAFIALDWYRFAEYDKSLETVSKTNFSKNFNIYCQAWTGSRKYRLKFLELLQEKNIDKKSNIFFKNYSDNTHYSNAISEKDNWGFKKESIDNLTCNTSRNIDSSASATYNSDDYKNSAIDVVLETVFDRDKIQLTEKILRPIACGKPFILVSEKGSLEYLKSYGFKTFGDLVDESYDSVTNPLYRLYAVIDTMKQISAMPDTSKNQLFLEMHEIAEYNKKWFFSERFFKLINNELSNNLKRALSVLDNPMYQTAAEPTRLYRAYRRYKKHLTGVTKDIAEKYIFEYPERIELSKKNIGKY